MLVCRISYHIICLIIFYFIIVILYSVNIMGAIKYFPWLIKRKNNNTKDDPDTVKYGNVIFIITDLK